MLGSSVTVDLLVQRPIVKHSMLDIKLSGGLLLSIVLQCSRRKIKVHYMNQAGIFFQVA